MKYLKVNSVILVGALAWIGAPSLILGAKSVKRCGKLARVKGRVEVLRLKHRLSDDQEGIREMQLGTKKMKLFCDDVIVTGRASRAKLRLRNNVSLTLGPHSRLEILKEVTKRGKLNLLKLTYGKVRALLKEQKPGKVDGNSKKEGKGGKKYSKFIIKTPTVVAGVRGTDFFLSFKPNERESTQATIDGIVEVSKPTTGERVIVKSGQQVAVKKSPRADKMDEEADTPVPLQTPMEVKPIKKKVIQEIRQTSALVKRDKEFTSEKAVALLGKPDSWLPPPDEIPYELKDIKNEF